MKRIEAIFRPERLDNVIASLTETGFEGFTIQDARGHGRSPERVGEWRGVPYEVTVTHKLVITVIVEDDEVEKVANAIAPVDAPRAMAVATFSTSSSSTTTAMTNSCVAGTSEGGGAGRG